MAWRARSPKKFTGRDAQDSRLGASVLERPRWPIGLAEGVGFEPTRACALPVFKTGAINRSTTPPLGSGLCRRAGDNISASAERRSKSSLNRAEP